MRPERKYLLISAAAFVFAVVIGAVCSLFAGEDAFPYVVIGLMLFFFLFLIANLLLALKKSLSVSLYEYRNLVLIGAIIFVTVLELILISDLVWCLRSHELSLQTLYDRVLIFPRHFSYYALALILSLSVLLGISNIALIRHEGFCLNNALCLLVAGFYLVGTGLAYFLSDLLKNDYYLPNGLLYTPLYMITHTVLPTFFLVMLCYFECMLISSAIMGWAAARHVPAYDKDYIIILGCSLDRRGGLLPLLKGRVNRAIRFAWEQEIAVGKPAKYVPSGGQGPNEVISEGSAMELYLLSHGAEDDEVFPEKKSGNTWENMCFSKDIIDGLNPNAKIAFATTNYHILRSGILARKAGIDAEGVAGDTKWYFWPNGFVREFFGILKLSMRTHLFIAAAAAVLCTLIGAVGWFGSFL